LSKQISEGILVIIHAELFAGGGCRCKSCGCSRGKENCLKGEICWGLNDRNHIGLRLFYELNVAEGW